MPFSNQDQQLSTMTSTDAMSSNMLHMAVSITSDSTWIKKMLNQLVTSLQLLEMGPLKVYLKTDQLKHHLSRKEREKLPIHTVNIPVLRQGSF